MAVFISYSHDDSRHAETIAANLVQARLNVWIDKWEINAGESLFEKIEDALGTADAILVLLSKASVESEWCKKELRSGLHREMSEKSTLVIPIRLDDAEIPLFLREKLWIDLRQGADLDEQLQLLIRSLAKVSNPAQRRIEEPDFHADWSMTPINIGPEQGIEWSFVEHSEKLPFVVLTQVIAFPQGVAQKTFRELRDDNAKFRYAAELVREALEQEKDLSVNLDGAYPVTLQKNVGRGARRAKVQITVRRMGDDTGMDTLIHIDKVLNIAISHTLDVLR